MSFKHAAKEAHYLDVCSLKKFKKYGTKSFLLHFTFSNAAGQSSCKIKFSSEPEN
jgi:hypothetical protein